MTEPAQENPTNILAKTLFGALRRLALLLGFGLVAWWLFGQQFLPQSPPVAVPTPPSAALQPLKALPAPEPESEPEPPTIDTKNDERIAQLEEQIARQNAILDELKTQIRTSQTANIREVSTLTLLSMMKNQLDRGENFALPLNQLRALHSGGETGELLNQLQPYAEGIPTLAALQQKFAAAVEAALAPAPDAGFAAHYLHSLIRIRKVGTASGNDDEAVIARAEMQLDAGDIDACLENLSALSPAAAAAFADWRSDAQKHLRAHAAFNALQLALFTHPPAQPE